MPGFPAHPKVYVVSLVRATERRKAIREQLSRYGIDFAFVDAVDATEVGLDYLRSQVDEAAVLGSMKRRLGAPEIACALSHRRVYQAIFAGEHPGAVVLEDDAILTPLFADSLKFFGRVKEEIKGAWIVYNLEVMSKPSGRYFLLKRKSAQIVNDQLFFAEIVPFMSMEVHGAVGYYITAEAARKLIGTVKISASPDMWCLHAKRGNGKVFASVPYSIKHPPEPGRSHIEAARKTEIEGGSSIMRKSLAYIKGGARARFIKYIAKPIADRIL